MFIQKLKREVATLRDIIYHRLYYKPSEEKDIINQFHKLYYDSYILNKTWGIHRGWALPLGNVLLIFGFIRNLFLILSETILLSRLGLALGGSAYF